MEALKYIVPVYIVLYLFYGIKRPKEFLLLTGIVTLPFETTYSFIYAGSHTGWVSGIQISISEISLLLLFIFLKYKKHNVYTSKNIVVPLCLFILSCVMSLINTTAGLTTAYQIIMISVTSFLYYFVVANSIDNEKDLYNVAKFLLIALLFQSSISIVQHFTGNTLDVFSTGGENYRTGLMVVGGNSELFRVKGTTPHPNPFAAYLVPLIIINISILYMNRRKDYFRMLVVFLGIMTLIFTFSRGGWISFIAAVTSFIIIGIRQKLFNFNRAIALFAAVTIVVAIFFPLIQERIIGDDNNAAMSRLPLIEIAFNMIKEHPLVGIGANNYTNVMSNYLTNDLKNVWIDQVHNQYLLVFAETGLFGLITFLWLMLALIRENIPCIKQNKNRYLKYVSIGIVCSFIAISIHMMTDLFNSRLCLGLIFMLGGLSTAINKMNLRQAKASI